MILENQRFEIGRGYIFELRPENGAEIIILQSISSNTGIADNELSDNDTLEIAFPMTIE